MFILGVDGGGTNCRARLCDSAGTVLGEGLSGPANIRLELSRGFAAAFEAAAQCMRQAGLPRRDMREVTACLAFAGATEPSVLAAAQAHKQPFGRAIITSDGHAACIGAHGGADGGVIAIGTGFIGWAVIGQRDHRVGGWGFPVSDEGSGAWLGCEALRRALWAHDGRFEWTPLLRAVFRKFGSDPHLAVRWTSSATTRDYAGLAPLVTDHAEQGDPVGIDLMRIAAGHVDAAAARLAAIGAPRLSIVGGLGPMIEPWLTATTKRRLTPPQGTALDGALRLARAAAEAMAVAE